MVFRPARDPTVGVFQDVTSRGPVNLAHGRSDRGIPPAPTAGVHTEVYDIWCARPALKLLVLGRMVCGLPLRYVGRPQPEAYDVFPILFHMQRVTFAT